MTGYRFEKADGGRSGIDKSMGAQLGQRLRRHYSLPEDRENDRFAALLGQIKEKFDQKP